MCFPMNFEWYMRIVSTSHFDWVAIPQTICKGVAASTVGTKDPLSSDECSSSGRSDSYPLLSVSKIDAVCMLSLLWVQSGMSSMHVCVVFQTLGNMEQIIIALSAVSIVLSAVSIVSTNCIPLHWVQQALYVFTLVSGILVSGKNYCIQVLQNHVGGQAYTWQTLAVTPTLASSSSSVVGFVELYRQCRSHCVRTYVCV